MCARAAVVCLPVHMWCGGCVRVSVRPLARLVSQALCTMCAHVRHAWAHEAGARSGRTKHAVNTSRAAVRE